MTPPAAPTILAFEVGGRAKEQTVTSLSSTPPQFTRQTGGVELRVAGGADSGRHAIVREEPVLVGTGPDCELQVTDATVSRAHLEARWLGGLVRLVDRDSKNGSFYAGSRFRELDLPCGAELTIGRLPIKILPAEEAIDPAPSDTRCCGQLVGDSRVMRKIFSVIHQFAATDLSVVIEGETGVGKELVAEELHRRSFRRDGPFIVFDCGAVSSELIESTLFGHLRGSFTGAVSDHPGIFGEADGGTVFLDEIGELAPRLQPALLRVLDRGLIRPIGASAHRAVDVRIIAATNRNLRDMVQGGAFREDLYYRLSVVRLAIPPLRDRLDDLPLLVRSILHRRGRPDLRVTDRAMAKLSSQRWPGNCRELQNIIEAAIAVSAGGYLELDDIEAITAPRAHSAPEGTTGAETFSGRPFRAAKAEVIESFEREYLAGLMAAHPQLTRAAEAAKMDRKHLRTLLRRYGMRSE